MLRHNFIRIPIVNTIGFVHAPPVIYYHPQFYYMPQRVLAYIVDELTEQNVAPRTELDECPSLTKEDLDLLDQVAAFNAKYFL